MPSLGDSFPAMLDALSQGLGPALPPLSTDETGISFSLLVASLLSRTYAPRQVRTTLEALDSAGLLNPDPLAKVDLSELVAATQSLPSPDKSLSAKTLRPLHLLARWVVESGGLDAIAEMPTERLRDDLRAIPGIGPASADALLLHALKRPVYPVDRATYRILARHGWIDPTADYDEARSAVEAPAYDDPGTIADLTSWFSRVGELYCRATRAKCERCPLRPFLPEGGPYEAADEA